MKFNTQFSTDTIGKFLTLTGDSKEIIYDLKYMQSGEPYLSPTGKVRDVFDEIQKARVMLVDIADLYERSLQGEDCLNIVVGGDYFDASVFDQDMIVNANKAYQNMMRELNKPAEKSAESTESEEKSE